MKPKKPLTTRRLLLWVFFAALVLGLYWPFIEVGRNPALHYHTYVVRTEDGRYRILPDPTREPYLTLYWRRLSGTKPPAGKRHCGMSWGQAEEVCALEHPEIMIVSGPLGNFQALPHQDAYANRMNAELDRKKAEVEAAKSVQPIKP